jgi:hypothetical protein
MFHKSLQCQLELSAYQQEAALLHFAKLVAFDRKNATGSMRHHITDKQQGMTLQRYSRN